MIGTFVDCDVAIDGKRLCLVPTTKAHLDKCLEMVNNPEISRFLLHRFAFTEEQEAAWLNKTAEDQQVFAWSIHLGDEHVGQTGLHGINWLTGTATTGIMIDKPYWGKGIAKAVMKARAQFSKDQLNLIALYTEICEANKYSVMAARSVGYQCYGHRPFGMYTNGKYHKVWLGCLRL